MKLTDYKNEDALSLLADIIEPVAGLFGDKKIAGALKAGQNLKAVQIGLKNHQEDIIRILAALDGVDPEEYSGNILTMTQSLLDLLNDKEILDFFISQGQTGLTASSGPASESTEE